MSDVAGQVRGWRLIAFEFICRNGNIAKADASVVRTPRLR